jgi:hypothetical protein
MQVKLLTAFIAFLLILTSTGCLWLHGTTWTFYSSSIGDADGFPVLTVSFNLSDYATLSLSDPAGTLLQSNEFYHGIHDAQLLLGAYRTNPQDGTYTLTVTDASHKTIATHDFTYTPSQLVITSCSQQWFRGSDETVLSLNLTVENKGQLPFYPSSLSVSFAGKNTTGHVLPTVILPSASATVTAILLLHEVLTNLRMTINLLDAQGSSCASSEQTITSTVSPNLQYSWNYLGRHQLTIPNATALYWYDRSLPREQSEDYGLYVFNSLDDDYLNYVLHRLIGLSGTTDSMQQLNFIAGFVQSLEYREDSFFNASYEYPRYPVETLNEHGGDCEDKAILCAQLLTLAGYNVTLIRLPDHMAVGVRLAHVEDYTAFADGYYFLESTAGFSPVGRVPSEFLGVTNYTLFPISSRPLYVHNWLNATHYQSSNENFVLVTIVVKNLGLCAAPVDVRGFFAAGMDQYNIQKVSLTRLNPGSAAQVSLRVNVPSGIATLLKTQTVYNGVVQDERDSASMFVG